MVYPIYVYDSAVLKKIAGTIEKDYQDLEQFIKDMFETMYASDGVGLAAPQVGKSIRLFVIDTNPFMDEGKEGIVKVFINAEIIERFGEEEYFNEGCLSVPGINEDVLRYNKIRIKYLDENFVAHEEVFDDVAARVIQHEYDHLEGMLFIEHVSPLRKRLLKSKLMKMAKGDFTARFACKQVK
ncbi:MAG: peptide deformylase [Rikenellaceae bacterium]